MRTGQANRYLLAAAVAVAVAGSAAAADDFLADPTRPVDFTVTAGGAVAHVETGPRLQSTRVSATQKSAVIDGKTYRIGDRFAGSEITGIEPYEVVLRKPERGGATREWQLRMVPRLTKALGPEATSHESTKTEKAGQRANEESK
jgi:hypothetical protein